MLSIFREYPFGMRIEFDSSDSARYDFNKPHFVVIEGRVAFEASSRSQALIWVEGFLHAMTLEGK